jgi:hypothetical protein
MRRVVLVSLVLFTLGCCLPALEFKHSNGPNSAMWGVEVLLMGCLGILVGIGAWYANPFWLIGMVLGLFRKGMLAAIAGIIAIAIAANTFTIIGRVLPADEGDVTHMTVVRLLPGCYVWMASLVVLPLAAIFRKPKPEPAIAPGPGNQSEPTATP